jgi:hypothetical protein
MLPSQIKNRVKRQFGDVSGAQLTDADIVDWINEAQREIYTKNNLGMTVGTVPTIIGTNEYSPPANLMRLFSVKYDGGVLAELSLQDIDNVYPNYDKNLDRGTPSHYWTYADKIILYPVPDAVKNLTIRYNRFPVDIAADDTIPLDLDLKYHNRVLDYCYAQSAQLDGDMQSYTLYIQKFEGKVQATADDEFEMQQQRVYSSITVSPRDSDYWGDYG